MNIAEVIGALTLIGVCIIAWSVFLLMLHETVTESEWYRQIIRKRMNK